MEDSGTFETTLQFALQASFNTLPVRYFDTIMRKEIMYMYGTQLSPDCHACPGISFKKRCVKISGRYCYCSREVAVADTGCRKGGVGV